MIGNIVTGVTSNFCTPPLQERARPAWNCFISKHFI